MCFFLSARSAVNKQHALHQRTAVIRVWYCGASLERDWLSRASTRGPAHCRHRLTGDRKQAPPYGDRLGQRSHGQLPDKPRVCSPFQCILMQLSVINSSAAPAINPHVCCLAHKTLALFCCTDKSIHLGAGQSPA
ncbi:hypothetical protein AAFF_G00024520 [Aldrovandia affinis]|uniref:Uncharacterized protein n=1 Tax=Aldrovandia affinis TaxID=143900 RepID=A0AAD7X0I0_9TELE|nr:hypothetical protein AAFF_G00024520 [Aldrovandia affinis]